MSVESQPGTYRMTEDEVGARFAYMTVRTYADVTDPDDIAEAHAAPDWDLEKLAIARKALNDIATVGFDSSYAFGSKKEVRAIDHLIGAVEGRGRAAARRSLLRSRQRRRD